MQEGVNREHRRDSVLARAPHLAPRWRSGKRFDGGRVLNLAFGGVRIWNKIGRPAFDLTGNQKEGDDAPYDSALQHDAARIAIEFQPGDARQQGETKDVSIANTQTKQVQRCNRRHVGELVFQLLGRRWLHVPNPVNDLRGTEER